MCAYRRSGHRLRRQADGVIICEQGALICACALIWESGRQVFELITHYLTFVALRRRGLILILLLLFGGGGSYYAYGLAGEIGIVGIILIVLIMLLVSGHLSIR
jgi:hypothetical protein